jgi:hypothetical protein
MSSVALWYQSEPHKPWAALPPGAARLPFTERRLVVGHKAVPTAKHSEHPIQVQEVGGVTDGKQLWFTPANDQGWVEVTFSLDKEQTLELWCKMLHSWDYGTYRVRLDGKEVAKLDLHSVDIGPKPHKLGIHTLGAGEHAIKFECAGKAEASKGYFLGFDTLSARQPVYSRAPTVDLRTLQVGAPGR